MKKKNIENDVPLMTSDEPIKCDEDKTDCTKCCACEWEIFFVQTIMAFDVHILHRRRRMSEIPRKS